MNRNKYSKNDFDKCKRIVCELLPNISDHNLEKLSVDVLETTYSIGGNYSEKCLKEVILTIINSSV